MCTECCQLELRSRSKGHAYIDANDSFGFFADRQPPHTPQKSNKNCITLSAHQTLNSLRVIGEFTANPRPIFTRDMRLCVSPKLVLTKHSNQYQRVNLRGKIISWDQLSQWRAALRSSHKRLVVTNGCFDLLHPGHVFYLEAARNLGDALLIGLNGDTSVQELKGPGRPVNTEADRAFVLAALESVTGVCIFAERAATNFLLRAKPDIYVKGGDYTLASLNQDERRAVEQNGGEVAIIPFTPGKSTTALLKKISCLS